MTSANQHRDRVEAHRLQRVDFLAHLHGAKLGGVGASRAPRDHDGDDQHADFAQDQNADHVDDVNIRAEPAEMEKSLLRDDAADQEGDEQDDRYRLPADPVEMMYGRCQSEGFGLDERIEERRAHRAEHVQERHETARGIFNRLAEIVQCQQDRIRLPCGRIFGAVCLVHFVEQAAVMVLQADDLRLAIRVAPGTRQPLEQPGSEGVELADCPHIDGHARFA